MGKISKSYLKDKFVEKQNYQVGGTKMPKTEYSSDNGSYWPNNPVKNYTGGNSLLAPGGTKKVQDYQRYLNDTYNLYLAEDGAWGPKTQTAYETYVINKQAPTYTPVSVQFNRDTYTIDDKGQVFRNPGKSSQESFSRLKPTLEEFKAVYESLPGYNYGYASLTDSDPKTMEVQKDPLSPERVEQLAKMPPEQELRNMYLGKSFGTLPLIEAMGPVYQGYSPHRMWTSDYPFLNGVMKDGDGETTNPNLLGDIPRYMYIMTPKEGTQAKKLHDESFLRTNYDYVEKNPKLLEDTARRTANMINTKVIYNYASEDQKKFVDYVASLKSEDYKKPEVLANLRQYKDIMKTGRENNLPYTQATWTDGERMAAEFLANPEIVEYAKQNNINLTPETYFSSQLGEAINTRRRALFYNEPIGINSQSVNATIIQNPEQFSFAGYLPLTPDMFNYTTEGEFGPSYSFKGWTPELLEMAGVPENLRDLEQLYMTTSAFPIQEYKPRKDTQGNIYKKGGKLKSSYKNKRG